MQRTTLSEFTLKQCNTFKTEPDLFDLRQYIRQFPMLFYPSYSQVRNEIPLLAGKTDFPKALVNLFLKTDKIIISLKPQVKHFWSFQVRESSGREDNGFHLVTTDIFGKRFYYLVYCIPGLVTQEPQGKMYLLRLFPLHTSRGGTKGSDIVRN